MSAILPIHVLVCAAGLFQKSPKINANATCSCHWSLVARRCTHARVMVIIVCIWCIFASRIVNAFDEVVHLQAASELIHAYAIIVVIAMAKWQNGKTKTKTKNKSHHINVNSNLFAFALVKIFQRMSWVVKSFRINTDTPTIIYKRILRISKI